MKISELFPDGTTVRHYLFNGMKGCSAHDCVITPKECGNNDGCVCFDGMSISDARLFKSRLKKVCDIHITDIDEDGRIII